MPSRITRRVLCAVCVLLLTSAAFAGDGGSWSITKRGLSGQVYAWQSGGC